jgi:hypothetical protein
MFNEQPYRQEPPVSVSTAFVVLNLATFVKEPLYKSTPRCANRETSDRGDTEIATSHQGEGVKLAPPSPSISLPHSHIHLLVISIFVISNIVRIFDIVIEPIYIIFYIFDLVMSD